MQMLLALSPVQFWPATTPFLFHYSLHRLLPFVSELQLSILDLTCMLVNQIMLYDQ